MLPLCYNAAYDDCMRCCVAGILQKTVTEVKDFNMFLKGNKDWYGHFRMYMKEKLDMIADAHTPEVSLQSYSIGIMRSMDMKTTHAVIMKPNPEGGEPEIYHDPDLAKPIYKQCIARITLRPYVRKIDMRDAMKVGEIDVS